MAASTLDHGGSKMAPSEVSPGSGASKGAARSKAELADAGRRKLEAFRAKRKVSAGSDKKTAPDGPAATPDRAQKSASQLMPPFQTPAPTAAREVADTISGANVTVIGNGLPGSGQKETAHSNSQPGPSNVKGPDQDKASVSAESASAQTSERDISNRLQIPARNSSNGLPPNPPATSLIANGPSLQPNDSRASDDRTRRKLAFPEASASSQPTPNLTSKPATEFNAARSLSQPPLHLPSNPASPSLPPNSPPKLVSLSQPPPFVSKPPPPLPSFYQPFGPRAPIFTHSPPSESKGSGKLPATPEATASGQPPSTTLNSKIGITFTPKVATSQHSQTSYASTQATGTLESIPPESKPPSSSNYTPPPRPSFLTRSIQPEQVVTPKAPLLDKPPKESAVLAPSGGSLGKPSTNAASFSLDDLLSGANQNGGSKRVPRGSEGASSTKSVSQTQQVKEPKESLQSSNSLTYHRLSDSFPKPGPPLSPMGLRPAASQDFSSLEQHIADLTAEKYTLQRAVDTTRGLAESLEGENSRLTEDFNKQGGVINQLKAEIERQNGEIKAQHLVFKAMNEERDSWQRENASAREQAQVMGREVVQLEEQVLKLRSRELKLEKEVSELRPEFDQVKRQLASVSADRTSLRQIIENLQEERRMLLSRLRRAGVLADLDHLRAEARAEQDRRADAATDTADLGPSTSAPPEAPTNSASPAERVAAAVLAAMQNPPSQTGRLQALAERTPVPPGIPDEQARIINSINALLEDIGAERQALLATLSAETRANGELRTANAELSRKLAVVTQRLELAVAQAMTQSETAGTASTPRRASSMFVTPSPQEEVVYMDEGDEVVDRVLGWLSRLFAGKAKPRQLQRTRTLS